MTAVDSVCSCDADHANFVPIEQAWRRAIEGITEVSGEELVPLRRAYGRVTARPVISEQALPPFDQSAMDGYAVRTRDFASWSGGIPIVGRRAAGDGPQPIMVDGPAAVRIFTGSVIPDGFDAVVMQEDSTQTGGSVIIHKSPRPGQHIRVIGDDVTKGSVIVGAGTLIDGRHISILAAAGVSKVSVRRRVRVGVVSTGNELREPGDELCHGQIHDSNRAMLLSLVEGSSVDATDLGRIDDNPGLITGALKRFARDFDVLITSGGASVGEEDHIQAAVIAAGGSFERLRAAIKPGKPASFGRVGGADLIGLPGNPVSALVTFLWFGRPVVMRRTGCRPAVPISIPARAGFEESRSATRDEFVPVVINGFDDGGHPFVERRRRAGSARLSSLIDADGLARVPAGRRRIVRGDEIALYPFSGAFSL